MKRGSSKGDSIFVLAFKGILGVMAARLVVVAISAAFISAGYYLVQKNNKEGTKPLRDIQSEQYLGVALMFIGFLPWMEYVFMSFAFNAGEAMFDEMF